jgi:hypothetical protein
MVVDVKVTSLFTKGLPGETVKLVDSGIGPMLRPTFNQSTLTEFNRYPSVPISIPARVHWVLAGSPHAAKSPLQS